MDKKRVMTPKGPGYLTAVSPTGDGNTISKVDGIWWDSRLVSGLVEVCVYEGHCWKHPGNSIGCAGCPFWRLNETMVCDHAGPGCHLKDHPCEHREAHAPTPRCPMKTCGGYTCACVRLPEAPAAPAAPTLVLCEFYKTCALRNDCARSKPHEAEATRCQLLHTCEALKVPCRCIPAPEDTRWRPARLRYDRAGEGQAVEIRFEGGEVNR